MAKQLRISVENLKNYVIADGVPLFPVNPFSTKYPGDTEILGKEMFSAGAARFVAHLLDFLPQKKFLIRVNISRNVNANR